jgi:hypothetical protein
VSGWKSKYGGMESSELTRLRAIEAENACMRHIIADLSAENGAMKQLIERTPEALAAKRRGKSAPRLRTQPAGGLPRVFAFGCSVPDPAC